MNITFLIGNGFDLACGLPTSYAAVYEEYIKEPSESLVVKKFKEDLKANKTKEKWGNWADFEMGMADYAKNFETEVDFIECVSDFKSFLSKYLRRIELDFYKNFKIQDKETHINFRKLIDEDIKGFYKGFTKNLERNIGNKIGWRDRYDFISFNYTRVLDRILKFSSFETIQPFHAHGEIGESMALGVSNDSQIKSNFQLTQKGKRVFVKPFFNEEFDEISMRSVMQIITSSECICVLGLSLGDSDLMWKTGIINWLKDGQDRHLFIYDYFCSNIEITDAALRMNKEDDQKEIILKRLGVYSEISSILGQVHIAIGKKLFNCFPIIQELSKPHKPAISA